MMCHCQSVNTETILIIGKVDFIWDLCRWNSNTRAREDGFLELLYITTGREYEEEHYPGWIHWIVLNI